MANIDIFTTDVVTLLGLKHKFVELQLTHSSSIKGFVYAIDPDQNSVILLDTSEESFQTMLIPGHAILNISIISDKKFPLDTEAETVETNVVEKKQKLISWLQSNLIPVTETDENIIFGGVTIFPPYNISNVYTTSPIVANKVKDLIENMPNDF